MFERGLAILCIAACCVACSSGESPDKAKAAEAAPEPAAAVQDDRLIGRQWRLESFGAVGEERVPIGIEPITLQFNQDGWIDGSTGCATYRTTYRTAADGTLVVRAVVRLKSTNNCPSTIERQDEVYVDVLHRAESYEVHDDRLLVFYEGGSRNLVYTGATSSSSPAPAGSSQTPSS